MTPSQEAKEYAAAYGFVIEPSVRRYDVWFAPEGEPRNHVTQVGGYPAALNAMKAYVSADDHRKTDAALEYCDQMLAASDTELLTPDAARKYVTLTDTPVDPNCRVYFDNFDSVAQRRIRKAARKLRGKPPGGPWHVMYDGLTVMMYGYPSRAEAVAVVRWGFNHPDTRIRNNWRTHTVTVEYRAS